MSHLIYYLNFSKYGSVSDNGALNSHPACTLRLAQHVRDIKILPSSFRHTSFGTVSSQGNKATKQLAVGSQHRESMAVGSLYYMCTALELKIIALFDTDTKKI